MHGTRTGVIEFRWAAAIAVNWSSAAPTACRAQGYLGRTRPRRDRRSGEEPGEFDGLRPFKDLGVPPTTQQSVRRWPPDGTTSSEAGWAVRSAEALVSCRTLVEMVPPAC